MSKQNYFDNLQTLAKEQLAPLAKDIDEQGIYPREFMHSYGEKNGFAAHSNLSYNGLGYGIYAQIQAISILGQYCGSTAFSTWCQTSCAWYIQNSDNEELKERYLNKVLSGKLLAGTGLSNTVKSLSGIEEHKLKAEKTDAGYKVNGALPWVTNIGEDHIFAATAKTEDGNVMFIVEGNQAGVTLSDAIKFCALNGTQTLSANFKDVIIEPHQVLAYPDKFSAYLNSIKCGFVLLQLGMALGVLKAAREIIAKSDAHISELNKFLPYGAKDLQESIAYIEQESEKLGADILNEDLYLPVLKLRLYASKAALAAAQAAALHAGAAGYIAGHHAQRLSREAMFIAIITPSVKHLQREINRLENIV